MNRRAKGNRNENRSAKYYGAEYYTMTSRASAGPIDIACIAMQDIHPRVILIQSKTGYVDKDTIEGLKVLEPFFKTVWGDDLRVEVHVWKPNRRTPDITIIQTNTQQMEI